MSTDNDSLDLIRGSIIGVYGYHDSRHRQNNSQAYSGGMRPPMSYGQNHPTYGHAENYDRDNEGYGGGNAGDNFH